MRPAHWLLLSAGLAAASCTDHTVQGRARETAPAAAGDGTDLTLSTERRPRPSVAAPAEGHARPVASGPAPPPASLLGSKPAPDPAESLALDLPRERITPRVEAPRRGPATTSAPPKVTAKANRGDTPPPKVDRVRVSVSRQQLELWAGDTLVATYPVSTATNGAGSKAGSQRTPLGRHRVHAKFGAGAPLGAVFESRQATGSIARIHTEPVDLPEDVITTRILWLEGLETGKNRGPGVDSKDRYIYIHGTNEEGLIGRPASHGCVRMRNADVVEVFERVPERTLVEIVE